jgi:hypothetical protein
LGLDLPFQLIYLLFYGQFNCAIIETVQARVMGQLRRSVPEEPIPHFMVSGNSSIRVTSKPFGANSAIFTKMWVRHLWQALSASLWIGQRAYCNCNGICVEELRNS